MWTNAQSNGRPAEYRWRPLFNVTKFGWRQQLEFRAVTLPRRERRNPLKFAGVPKTPEPISAASRLDMHSKFALRPHHVWKYMVGIQCAAAEIRRGKKEERKNERR